MSRDLHAVMESQPLGLQFMPYMFKAGVGVSAGADIGLAGVETALIGHAYFKKNKTAKRDSISKKDLSQHQYVDLFKQNPPSEHLDYAREKGIQVIKTQSKSHKNLVRYRIDRRKFRKGLRKAIEIGQSMVEPAKDSSDGSLWGIYEMRLSFKMSLDGGSILPFVDEFVTAQMVI